MRRGIGLAALICGFFGTGASAEVVSETLTFTDEYSIFLPYSGFDPSLGTLTGVEAVLEGMANLDSGEITGTIGGEWPDLFVAAADGFLTVRGPGPIKLSSPLLDGLWVSCYPKDFCTVTYPSERGFTFEDTDSAEILTGFEAPGGLDLMLTTWAFTASGTLVSGPTTRWLASGSVTLEYAYDPAPVPLPAGLPLMIAGLGGLGLMARRRS